MKNLLNRLIKRYQNILELERKIEVIERVNRAMGFGSGDRKLGDMINEYNHVKFWFMNGIKK